MNVNLSPLEIDFLLRELQANQGMIAPSASIPAWYRHSIQETLRDALLADRKRRIELQDQKIKELMEEEARQNQERLKQQLEIP
jgi:E3 ubiquitin-protein ligase DOA10